MTDLPVFVNGAADGTVNPADRGLHYGHGLFETMRLCGGTLPLWDWHWSRLCRGTAALGIPLDRETVWNDVRRACGQWPADGVIKLMITASSGGMAYRHDGGPCNRYLFYRPLPERRDFMHLRVCDYRLPVNPRLAGLKHLNRLDQVLAAAELPPDRDGLLLDTEGRVIEGLAGNLFLRTADGWLTPDVGGAGVRGVMRDYLLAEIFPALGLAVRETGVALSQVHAAQELFLCNAVRGIQAVTAIDGSDHPLAADEIRRIKTELARRLPCFAA
ncbi:MAG: aminodeoxychorismate lyase [Porticoccaceae bacterium]|nr:MAG: aminodeoxychorismate lyase [Porticoccaceae bacterium]